jgi:hypothetical protein
MPTFRAQSFVPDAAPSAVLSFLLRFDDYPQWCPFTEEMACNGPVTIGSLIIEQVRLAPGDSSLRETRVIVTELSDSHVTWTNTLLHPCLLFARRVQRVSRATDAVGRDGTLYETEDTMSGALCYLVGWLFGRKVTAGLQAVADALVQQFTNRRRP